MGEARPRSGNMSRLTLGKLILDTARGESKQRSIAREEVQELNQNLANEVTPRIESIRAEERRALEDSKPVVLL
jgi:hypothetical protein